MTGPNSGNRPSEAHIIWSRETREGITRKQFDTTQFEQWADRHGVAFEREERVDHERGMDERTQYRCVFARTSNSEQAPRTFVEIDGDGIARIQGWDNETIVDVTALLYRGPRLLVRTADDETMQVDAEAFARSPEE